MRKAGLLILLAGMFLAYGNPALAREGREGQQGMRGVKAEKRGQVASEKRDQKARENSNAQWSAATKGQDRAALRSQSRSHGLQARGHGNGRARQGIQNRNSKQP